MTVYSKPQPTMEYSKSVVAKQSTAKSVLVLPKDIHSTSIHEDTMRYSIPIQAEDDGRNSMLVASACSASQHYKVNYMYIHLVHVVKPNNCAYNNYETWYHTHRNGNHTPDNTRNYMLVWPQGTKKIKQSVE